MIKHTTWISIKDKKPPISYLGSDNAEDLYECHPVLVLSKEEPGIYCVAYLVKNQNENHWNFGKLSWEFYIPGQGGDIIERDFDTFTHWMPLPEPPKE